MAESYLLAGPALQERVTLREPEHGWTRQEYDHALGVYAEGHGRPPQTATMHPDTAVALGLSEHPGAPTTAAPLLVTSRNYERRAIVWYY